MPTNIAIIQTRDFIRAKPDGALDLDASRKLLVEVVSAIRRAGERNVLIDTRAAAPARLLQDRPSGSLASQPARSPFLHKGEWPCWLPWTKKTTRNSSRVSLASKAQTSGRFPTSKARSHGSWLLSRPGFEGSRSHGS